MPRCEVFPENLPDEVRSLEIQNQEYLFRRRIFPREHSSRMRSVTCGVNVLRDIIEEEKRSAPYMSMICERCEYQVDVVPSDQSSLLALKIVE